MNVKKMKVISIDKDNLTFLCDDEVEYPLMEGCEDMTILELQKFIDNAGIVVQNILNDIDE